MKTRTILGPAGDLIIPGEPEVRTRCSEICVNHVLEGEYNYERPAVEDVASILDVGCNVGSFSVWAAHVWWPGRIRSIVAYDPNRFACAFATINTSGLPITIINKAVTVAGGVVLFKEHDDWGGSRTFGETSGVQVEAIHPRDLPAADVLKVDAEGVDPEIFLNYSHWPTVKVAMFEYHLATDREPMEQKCVEAGLTQVRHHGSPPVQGIQIWVRR